MEFDGSGTEGGDAPAPAPEEAGADAPQEGTPSEPTTGGEGAGM